MLFSQSFRTQNRDARGGTAIATVRPAESGDRLPGLLLYRNRRLANQNAAA